MGIAVEIIEQNAEAADQNNGHKKLKSIRASDQAYSIIKTAILKGRLKPGEKLGKRSMAALCKVSITPIIDALNRLETEGFVESTPYNSSRVVSLDEQRLADVHVLREAIEVQIIRMLCFTIGLKEAMKLRELAVKIDSMAGHPDKSPDYDEMHYKFHIQLAEASGSRNLVDQMESLHIFSLLSKSEVSYTSLDSDLLIQDYSHEDIINAILKRNPEEAERIVRNHVYRSRIIPPPYWI